MVVSPISVHHESENAKDFVTLTEALAALTEARKLRPFKNAQIQDEFF